MFKITNSFLVQMANLERLVSNFCSVVARLNNSEWNRCLSAKVLKVRKLKVRRLNGYLHFVRWYNGQNVETKLQYAGELKRRTIRQKDSLANFISKYGSLMWSHEVMEQFRVIFRIMNEVDGSRDVPLTPKLSRIGRKRS